LQTKVKAIQAAESTSLFSKLALLNSILKTLAPQRHHQRIAVAAQLSLIA
jgi:hypothetical protein